jgi:cytochrome P450
MASATSIPGPVGHPVFGIARELRRDLFGTLLDSFRRYGDLVLLRAGPARAPSWARRELVGAFHPNGVRQVLGDERAFTRQTTSFGVLRELFGENLVTATGDVWRRQKRTLQPLFTAHHVEQYASLMRAEARQAVRSLELTSDAVVDIADAMEGYALRILGRTLFGTEQGIDEHTVAVLGRLVPVVGGLVQSRAMQAVRLPLAWPTARNRLFVKTRAELYAAVERVLGRRVGRATLEEADDLLGRLLEARDPDTGVPLSAQEHRDQALIFLIAGHTTTSNALTSMLHLLASHPEVQEQVAQAALSSADDGGLVLAAVQEGMRLSPPSYAIGRRVLADTELDGHAIRAGTTVLVSPWITHRHPEFWDDPERFDPMRFLGAATRSPYAYFPFGGGARSCIGRHFAMLEATIMVRELLSAYKLVALDQHIPRAQQLSLRHTGPVRVRCQPRQARSAT